MESSYISASHARLVQSPVLSDSKGFSYIHPLYEPDWRCVLSFRLFNWAFIYICLSGQIGAELCFFRSLSIYIYWPYELEWRWVFVYTRPSGQLGAELCFFRSLSLYIYLHYEPEWHWVFVYTRPSGQIGTAFCFFHFRSFYLYLPYEPEWRWVFVYTRQGTAVWLLSVCSSVFLAYPAIYCVFVCLFSLSCYLLLNRGVFFVMRRPPIFISMRAFQ